MKLRDVIGTMLARPVAFHAVLAKVSGSATAGLMLSQAIYWSERTAHSVDGWFYKSQAEWEEEICLTRWEQETARRLLKAKGLMDDVRRGNPARLYYRVNQDGVAKAVASYVEGMPKQEPKPRSEGESEIVGKPQSRLRGTHTLDSGKAADKSVGKQQSYKEAETTTETTTKNQDLGNGAPAPLPSLFGEEPPKAKPKPSEPESDPRFQPVVAAIRTCWPKGSQFVFDAADGAALKRMLLRRHTWTAEELAECVVFRFLSVNVNPTESVKAWIGAVTDFASGPQDKFKNPPPERELAAFRRDAHKILYGDIPEQQVLTPAPPPLPSDIDEDRGRMVWSEVMAAVQPHINRHSFDTWLKPLRAIGTREHLLYVSIPTPEFRGAAEKYAELLRAALPPEIKAIEYVPREAA